jgi:argininosuccinate lyase
LEAVGHDHGISHSEVKLTPDGPRLVEINPRPGGNYIAELIQHVTGIDFLDTHIKLAVNIEPDLSAVESMSGSAAVKFLLPQKVGQLTAINGQAQLADNSNILRYQLADVVKQTINKPIDNACYLGHVITRDLKGKQARNYAEQAIAGLEVQITAKESV